MIDADYLTPEHELQQLVRKHAGTQTEERVRHTHRYKVVYRERDSWDPTPDAYDYYTGYGPTRQEAYDRAYAQTEAADSHAQRMAEMDDGS